MYHKGNKMRKTNPVIAKLNSNHWVFEEYRERVRRKEAQAILLEYSTIFFHGHIRHMRAKHVGAGIYEIYKAKEE